jgi:hypothetical protein
MHIYRARHLLFAGHTASDFIHEGSTPSSVRRQRSQTPKELSVNNHQSYPKVLPFVVPEETAFASDTDAHTPTAFVAQPTFAAVDTRQPHFVEAPLRPSFSAYRPIKFSVPFTSTQQPTKNEFVSEPHLTLRYLVRYQFRRHHHPLHQQTCQA